MSQASIVKTTSLFQVVADMQESMEENGFSRELVDVIVTRGLEVLLGTRDDSAEVIVV